MDRFDELFSKYDLSLTKERVAYEIERILRNDFDRNNVKSVYSKLLSFIDITSLNTSDSVESITQFVEKINGFDDEFELMPRMAAVCVYPSFVSTVKDTLREDMEIAVVAGGFPHSCTFTEVKVAEVSMAVMDGATEVDVVLPVGMMLSGMYEQAYQELCELRDAARGAKLKVIIESSVLDDPVLIAKASIISLSAGADFIKTSTGKEKTGATLEAAYVMASVLKKFNELNDKLCGLKVAGGISETKDAVAFYSVARSLMGDDFMTPDYFRIGASRLVNNLLSSLAEKPINYF